MLEILTGIISGIISGTGMRRRNDFNISSFFNFSE
jgi:hypothetical protein